MVAGLAGLSAVYPGFAAGQREITQNELNALRVRQAQQELMQAAREREAMGAAGAGLMMPDLPPGAMPMPGPGPQAPMPGQPSMPRAQAGAPMPEPGGGFAAGGAMPSMMQQPIPQAAPVPAVQPPGMGAPGTGRGAAVAPMGGGPTAPGSPSPLAGMDLRSLAMRIKAARPGIDDATLFQAVTRLSSALNPQGKMELQYLMGQMKQETVMAQLQAKIDQFAERETRLKESTEAKIAAQREASQLRAEIEQAKMAARDAQQKANLDAMMQRLEFLQGKLDERQKVSETGKGERQQTQVQAAQTRVETQQAGAAARQEAKLAAKAAPEAEQVDRMATEADALSALVKKDPSLVGVPGIARRALGSATGQLRAVGVKVPQVGAAASDFRSRVNLLQESLRQDWVKSKYFSKGAQERYNAIVAGLGATDDPVATQQALTNLAEVLRAGVPKVAPAAPGAAAAPAAQADQPPMEGARKAPDGNWYVQKDGKYYRVEQ